VKPVKKYELIFILRAELPESEMEARVERVREILGAHNGEITQVNHWGVRRLAYEIEYESRGNYMFLRFKSEGTAVADLDKFLRLDDQVLRHLVVVDEEWEDRNRAAIAKRRKNQSREAAGAPE
jgi:small subunit ribosomal protein S6